MCNVLIYDIPFGIRVFMHRDGVIREAKYRGMIVKDPGICGRNMYVEYIFWFGSKLGEGKIETSTSIYKTLEDAKREVNPIQHKILDIKSFSLRYLSCLIKDVQESIVKAIDKALERAIGNKVIDFEKCEGNYLDVYPLIGAVLQKELRSVLGENVNKSISRNMKIKATKYRNDYRVWLDYAGDYRNENIE